MFQPSDRQGRVCVRVVIEAAGGPDFRGNDDVCIAHICVIEGWIFGPASLVCVAMIVADVPLLGFFSQHARRVALAAAFLLGAVGVPLPPELGEKGDIRIEFERSESVAAIGGSTVIYSPISKAKLRLPAEGGNPLPVYSTGCDWVVHGSHSVSAACSMLDLPHRPDADYLRPDPTGPPTA